MEHIPIHMAHDRNDRDDFELLFRSIVESVAQLTRICECFRRRLRASLVRARDAAALTFAPPRGLGGAGQAEWHIRDSALEARRAA
jgi:hypothetical protein